MQIAIQEYGHANFQRLNDFDVSKKSLEQLAIHIARVGEIICGHNMQHLLGVNLLHKHFQLDENEFLLKKIDKRTNTAQIKPTGVQDLACGVPYLWSFSKYSDGKHGMYPLEYVVDDGSISDRVLQILENHTALASISEYIVANRVETLLGVCLLHESVSMSPAEVMVEETDSLQRVLTLSAQPESIADRIDVTETTWGFDFMSTADKEISITELDDGTIEIEKNGVTKLIRLRRGANRISKILGDGGETVEGLCIACCKAHCIKHQAK